MIKTELIIALDFDSLDEALKVVDQIGEQVTWYKVGKQLFTFNGPEAVKQLKNRNKKVFLDLKFHDITNTVLKAVNASIVIGADMVSFHAMGGRKMMKSVMKNNQKKKVLLIAVTILTSMNNEDLNLIGLNNTTEKQVIHLAKLAQSSGVSGVVCSPLEIDALRKECGKEFKLIVPGIRPNFSNINDQVRIMTPKQIAKKGVNYIIVGRPITQAKNKLEVVKNILNELNN